MDRNYKKINNLNKGLTLVELIVVISIFLIISGVAIFNYSNFSNTVSLQNITDDVALTIRKAQSFAIGARAVKNSSDETDFNKSYGIHFSTVSNPTYSLNGSKKTFLMFSKLAPATSNKYYLVPSSSVCDGVDNSCMEFFEILSLDEIEKISVYTSSGTLLTSDFVDIVFTRPSPRADICYSINASNACDGFASKVDIVISNGQTDTDKYRFKTISVQNTGQISIE